MSLPASQQQQQHQVVSPQSISLLNSQCNHSPGSHAPQSSVFTQTTQSPQGTSTCNPAAPSVQAPFAGSPRGYGSPSSVKNDDFSSPGSMGTSAASSLQTSGATGTRGKARGRKRSSTPHVAANSSTTPILAASHDHNPSSLASILAHPVTHQSPLGPSASSTEESTPPRLTATSQAGRGPAGTKKPKRRKVDHACVYCRRSHMTCDDKRPCTRCIRRNIGHLCRDEPKRKSGSTPSTTAASSASPDQKSGEGHGPLGSKDGQSESPTPILASNGPEPLPSSVHQPAALVVTSTSQSLTFTELQDSKNSNLAFHSSNASYSGTPPSPASPSNLKKTQTMKTNSPDTSNTGFSHPLSQSLTMDKGSRPAGNTGVNQTFSRTPFVNDWLGTHSILSQTPEFNQNLFFSEHANSEFASLGDFLAMIEDPNTNGDLLLPGSLGGSGPGSTNISPGISRKSSNTDVSKLTSVLGVSPFANNSNGFNGGFNGDSQPQLAPFNQYPSQPVQYNQYSQSNQQVVPSNQYPPPSQPVISDSARDKFFLTAADPSVDVSPEERLKQVIRAKVEAGLLQPFNYARGYARLQKYMDSYMNQSSKQRILKPLSVFRPAFRAIAQSLLDVDLVLVEEAFERMLLDYDRIFTSMAIPACLWRRTGEIYRGNKEFAGLVEVSVEDLRDGKLAIYELMSEESAVNYWEKYGSIAFDAGQKAVLTSCNLRTRDGRKRRACCFSFTIQRDCYNIPSCIIGNFIPMHP